MTRLSTLLLFSSLALAACGNGSTPGVPAAKPSAAAAALILATDPGEATSVVDAKIAGAADAVVVEGRIRLINAGLAAFTLIDVELPYCGQEAAEDCKTPWDYCCENNQTITANMLTVEAHTKDGKPIMTPALPDLRNLDRVKVKGKLTKDEHGNYSLLASGIYKVERPTLPGGLQWPQ